MNLWYNRKGEPVSQYEGLVLFESDRVVGLTDVEDTLGRKWQVSTVFLPIDHSFGSGPPILFETMVFGYYPEHLKKDERRCAEGRYQDRYSTEEEAELGHLATVALVKGWGREIEGVENEPTLTERLAYLKDPKEKE